MKSMENKELKIKGRLERLFLTLSLNHLTDALVF